MFGKNQQHRPEPNMVIQKEQHHVIYPKCDVCGNSVNAAVLFKHINDRQEGHNRQMYHTTYYQPTTICKQCLAIALELPVDPTKCSYCGK